MPKIIQLSPHIANLIAAGEVVERPASVVKELLENAVDAGASKITVEIRDGGMTFLRVTDNGCGMSAEDARTAFLRHATSKLRTAEDLALIGTMGFRGEALAAIASVSRIELLTKTAGAISGISLSLEAGQITEESEAGCPEGTTILIRDLFYNTPARMKFMKSDTVEGSRVASAVQLQALAHPEVAIQFLRDGKQILSTPGSGGLQAAMYCIYGRDCAKMAEVSSRWDAYTLSGYVTKPTDSRPSRAMQTFFVNDRPVKSRLLTSALEEAYRNQIMVGKFPGCVLHLTIPPGTVDVNVHPAKTEVKFLNEKAIFDCIHYGVLGTLNKTPDRPSVQFAHTRQEVEAQLEELKDKKEVSKSPASPQPTQTSAPAKKPDFFRTMNAEEFKTLTQSLKDPPQPRKETAQAAAKKVEQSLPLRETVVLPSFDSSPAAIPVPKELMQPRTPAVSEPKPVMISAAEWDPEEKPSTAPVENIPEPAQIPLLQPEPVPEEAPEQTEQVSLDMPPVTPWRMVGELYRTYILVEQGDEAFLIDKHAAHERINFEKLKANQETISAQALLTPVSVRLSPAECGELLSNTDMLEELGFEIEEFGENTVLLRQIPMDLDPSQAAETLDSLASDLLNGRREHRDTVRDDLLHTVACKAAIKAGWITDDKELYALCKQVMEREDLKYCPHGRPICVSLSKHLLEKQFKRIV